MAPFAAADLTIGTVTLSAGARYDYVRIPFENLLDPALDTVGRYKRFNPRVGVSVEVGPGARSSPPGAGASARRRSSRTPARIPSRPARCRSRWATIRRSSRSRPARSRPASATRAAAVVLDGSAYYTDVKNDIFLTPFGDETSPRAAPSTASSSTWTRPGGSARAGHRIPVPAGPLALPQLLLHPGDLPERGRDLHDPAATEEPPWTRRQSSIRSRPRTRSSRATACRWCRITRSSGGATRPDRASTSTVGADGRYTGKQ